jgi:hypothetical protein
MDMKTFRDNASFQYFLEGVEITVKPNYQNSIAHIDICGNQSGEVNATEALLSKKMRESLKHYSSNSSMPDSTTIVIILTKNNEAPVLEIKDIKEALGKIEKIIPDKEQLQMAATITEVGAPAQQELELALQTTWLYVQAVRKYSERNDFPIAYEDEHPLQRALLTTYYNQREKGRDPENVRAYLQTVFDYCDKHYPGTEDAHRAGLMEALRSVRLKHYQGREY